MRFDHTTTHTDPRRARGRRLAVLALCLATSACLGAGFKNYRRGEKLRQDGQLVEARSAMKEALSESPGNEKFRAGLSEVEGEIDAKVAGLVAEANALRKANDWKGAAGKFAAARRYKPDDAELAAHEALSKLKAEDRDRDGWYEGVLALSRAMPGNALVERSLDGARAAAYQSNVERAEAYLITGQGAEAWRSYQRAKEIQPSLPGLDADKYAHAEALHLAAGAELKLAAGDAVGAYEAYRVAYEKRQLPEIRNAMAKAKAKASRILDKLEQARAETKRERWRQAVAAYEQLEAMDGVPELAREESAAAKAKLVESLAAEAGRELERGRVGRARRPLEEALRWASFGEDARKVIGVALGLADKGAPGDARKALVALSVPPSDPIVSATRRAILESARSVLADAQRRAKREPKRALTLLSTLSGFSAELPELKALRREVLKSSFGEMLGEALRLAKSGDDEGAADLLQTALDASKAPKDMRDPTEAGCEHLKAKRYVQAEKAFQQALAAAPRSQLAQRGIDIARLRRDKAETEALAAIASGSGELEPHVLVLEAAREAEPGNARAKTGAERLARAAESRSDDAEAARSLGQAGRLEEMPAAARTELAAAVTALSKGEHAAAEAAFKRAVAAAPGSKAAQVGQGLARGRMLAALKSGAMKASGGDEAAAEAVARLLEADPGNAEAKAAIAALLAKAKAAAEAKDDAEAARYLGLVVVASRPAPGVKDALSRGNAALAKGDMVEAEKAYSDATDLESENGVGLLGLEIAKASRVASLQAAVAAAKSGEDFDRVRAALQRTLELDPTGEPAKKAFAELLQAAVEAGDAGNDRAAASLLDAANVVSRPEATRASIGEANALLGAGKHQDAKAAYAKIGERGRSQVAEVGGKVAVARIRQVRVAGAKTLEDGSDLDRGAAAAAELLADDATDADALRAVEAALVRAEKASDAAGAARELAAVGVATRAGAEFAKATEAFAAARFEEAESGFGALSGDAAKRAAASAKARHLAKLTAAMDGGDQARAESIRALLAADPTHAKALAELDALLSEAKAAGKKGDDTAAAGKLEAALLASGAGADVVEPTKVGITHLGAGRHAEAEQAFGTGLELAKSSKVLQTAKAIAQERRLDGQRRALSAITKGDPLPPAKVLATTLLVDPASADVRRALGLLLDRAKGAAKKGDDAETARMLGAAVLLEALPAATAQAVDDAGAQLAAAKFGEAVDAFEKINAEDGAKKSEVAALGRSLAHDRRLAVLRAELAQAEKSKDALAASALVTKLLDLAPEDRDAQRARDRIGKAVVGQRLAAAEAQRKLGKLGAAHLYLMRALALDEANAAARKALAAVEDELGKGLAFVIMVEPVPANPKCSGLEGVLRETLIDVGAAHEGLGGYVVPKDWLDAVEKGAADAPKVHGSFLTELASCAVNPAGGKATMPWKLVVPRRAGKTVIEGKVEATIPKGSIPVDEQDADAKNARKALAKELSSGLVGQVEAERRRVESWLLDLAEHWTGQKDGERAADALARLRIAAPKGLDGKRIEAVEAYLEAAFP